MERSLTIRQNDISLMDLGKVMVASGFFADSRQEAQAVVKILAGQELGFGPIASMTGVNIIKGRVTISANLIAAAIKRTGRYNYKIKRQDNDGCAIEFYESGQPIGTSEFTAQDAQAAGLAGQDNWRKYPRNMYFARAISNGAKWFCPDVFSGPIYTPDELGAEIDPESGEVIEYQPDPAPQPEPPKPANGNGHGQFATIDDLLYQLHQDFGLAESDAKKALKAAGYTTFSPAKSGEMYEAVKAVAHQAQVEAGQADMFDPQPTGGAAYND